MAHYIFKSTAVSELYGVTEDRSGANLDKGRGPWKLVKEAHLQAGQKLIGIGSDAALHDIAQSGVHYTKAGVQTTFTPGSK